MKICNSTCATVCHAGISVPRTACRTDGTACVLVRSSHHSSAAQEAPMMSDNARRTGCVRNGPGNSGVSTKPKAMCSMV